MKTFISLAVLALVGEAEAGVIQRRLNVQNLQFVPDESYAQTGFLSTHPHVFHDESYDEYGTNKMIEDIATKGEKPFEIDESGMQEFPSGIDTKAYLKKMHPMKSGLTGEEFDKSYVQSHFVEEDESTFNDKFANELDIYKLGQQSTNGGYNHPKWEGQVLARMRINPENPYDVNQTKMVHTFVRNLELDAQAGEEDDE